MEQKEGKLEGTLSLGERLRNKKRAAYARNDGMNQEVRERLAKAVEVLVPDLYAAAVCKANDAADDAADDTDVVVVWCKPRRSFEYAVGLAAAHRVAARLSKEQVGVEVLTGNVRPDIEKATKEEGLSVILRVRF